MAGAISSYRGLVPIRTLSGHNAGVLRRWHVSANNPQPIFQGAPVYHAGNGNVRTRVTSTVASFGIVGIAQGFEDANGKPLMFKMPTQGISFPSSTEGYVYVNENPHQTYSIESETTAAASMIGKFVDVTGAISGNSTTGVSHMKLRVADVTTTGVHHGFKVIGLSPFNFSRTFQGYTELEVVPVLNALTHTNKS